MLLKVSFDELNDIIRQKAPVKGLTLSYHAPDTAKVSLVLGMLGFLSPTLSATVKILSVVGSRLTAEIDAGGVGGFIMENARKTLIEKAPAGLIEEFDGKRAVLNLSAVPDVKKVLERIEVSGISFTEEAICLDGSLLA